MTIGNSLSVETNTFGSTLLGLELPRDARHPADLFSIATVEQYFEHDPGSYGYLFAQVFEPEVLREIALIEGLPYRAVAMLDHRTTAATVRLGACLDRVLTLPVIETINVASALVAVSRFEAAVPLLRQVAAATTEPRASFEVAMLAFMVSNRQGNGAGSARAFAVMRRAIATGSLPPERVLDACSQAVVWYLKRRELGDDDYRWFAETGTALAADGDRRHATSISSWYRALAMVPAARGDAATTRDYMNRARDAAEQSITTSPRAYEMHLMKTYLESSLKEHLYVDRSLDKAVEAGHALIALDPAWSPSYAELAEVFEHFGEAADAAYWYGQAIARGTPYLGHNLLAAARLHDGLSDHQSALRYYSTLLTISPNNPGVVAKGRELARRGGPSAVDAFEVCVESGVRRRGKSIAP